MTSDLDLAGIRARAEAATPGPWFVEGNEVWPNDGAFPVICTADFDAAHIASADPPTVIAMCDLIERQAGEIARLKAAATGRTSAQAIAVQERDSRFEDSGASLRADLAARLNGVVAEIAAENGTTPAEVLGTAIGFLRQAKEHRLAALTPKEDTSCRTA